MTDSPFVPPEVDLEKPNAARVYDWYLGGTTNWAIDREFGNQVLRTLPMVQTMARNGREFLGRGVHYLARQGITQFLDLGSGVPTVGNVHEIADSVNPDTRCVYVDNEPVAVAHSRVLLEKQGDPRRHVMLHGDLLHVEDVWERALATGALNPDKPIGLIVASVLYFFDEEQDPHGVVARYRDLLPAGSYFLTTHITLDGVPTEGDARRLEVVEQYRRSSAMLTLRSQEEIRRFFDGFELVEPGLVWLPQWHPDEFDSPMTSEFADDPALCCALGGLGRKP